MTEHGYSDQIEAILSKATMTVNELAVVLGVGRRQAYEAVRNGEIPSIRIGVRILISTRVVLRLLEAGTNQAFEGDSK